MRGQDSRSSDYSRREFLYQAGVFTVGGVVSLLLGIPLLGFVLSALTKYSSEQWVQVCTLDQINWDTPIEFKVVFKGENAPQSYQDIQGVFVIRQDSNILAFTNVCTHMTCSVRWLDWRQQILCPCHGGMYDRWGNLMGGPPPKSLPRYLTRVVGNAVFVANRFQEG
ncbi:MAG: Rieske (2Fe-2S) protein [Chloroflexi bacterium]|nr:Rieske (2Fe-2S) protein [Chloroflexota bacterium]